MSRFLAVLVLSALTTSAAIAAKDPCKGISVKKDAFGESRVFEGGDIDFTLTGTKAQITVEFTGGGGLAGYGSSDNRATIPEGTPVELKLADGSTLRVATAMEGGSVSYNVMGILVTKFPLVVSLSPDQLTAILAQDIVAARLLRGAETWMSLEVKPSDAAKWRTTVQCVCSTGNAVPAAPVAAPAPEAPVAAPAPEAPAAVPAQ